MEERHMSDTPTPRNSVSSPVEDFRRLLFDAEGRRLNRRQVLRRAVGLGLTLPVASALFAACGGDDDDDDDAAPTSAGGSNPTAATGTTPAAGNTPASGGDSTATTGTGGATGGGVNGGTLTLVITGNIPDLDPQSAYDSTASSVFFGTHEMLVRFKGSSTSEYQPMLASGWESNDDFSEWTFTIPEGIKFHDGSACDAAAVARSFQRFLDMGRGPVNVVSRFIDDSANITAPDATTVVFALTSPNPIFISAMASQYGPLVVSPTAMDENKTADDEFAHEYFLANCVGTGPYKLKEYRQNDSIVLERFEDFHGGWEGNHFDSIVYRIVVESSTRRTIVESGEGDALTQSLTPEDVTSIEEKGDLSVVRYDSTNADWIFMNYERLGSAKIREAMAWAFPYEDVRSGVYQDLVQRTSGPCTPTTYGYDPDGFIFDQDLDMAKQLLDEEGFDYGQTLEYWMNESSSAGLSTAQLFQAALEEIGVKLEISQREEGALTEFVYGEAPASERPHFVYWGWWPDYNDAWNEVYPNFHTDSITPNGSNAMYYSNAEVDTLLDEISVSVEEDVYFEKLAAINEILVKTDPAACFFGSWQWYTVMQKNIAGFTPNPIYINTYPVYDMYRTEG